MRKHNARRSLLGSLLMMLLSCSMLLGTTFAWFVDSETVNVSAIQAGSLDFSLEYALQPEDGKDLVWKPAADNAAFFGEGALWEPNYTGIVYLRVKNTGGLALKYRCSLEVTDNVEGTNRAGNPIDLRKYVQAGMTAPVQTSEDSPFKPYETDDAAITAAGQMQDLTQQITAASDQAILKRGEAQAFAVVLHMPSTVGNEANYKGETAPSFKLKITVDATQASYEFDSIGNTYDSAAAYAQTPQSPAGNEDTDAGQSGGSDSGSTAQEENTSEKESGQ